MEINRELENLVFKYIKDNEVNLDTGYLQSYPERACWEYYDTEHYQVWIFEEAYQRVLENININDFI